MDDPVSDFLLAKFVWLAAVYVVGIFVGVFCHELGHALAGLVCTKQTIELEVGRSEDPWTFRIGRLTIHIGFRGFRYGFTRYVRSEVGTKAQVVVALSGPLASASICLVCLILISLLPAGGWAWIAAVALLVSNLRIFIVSMWPMEYRPNGPAGEVWLSDALDIWRLLRGR